MKALVTGPALSPRYATALSDMGFDLINGTQEALERIGAGDSQGAGRDLTASELGRLLSAEVAVYVYGGLEAASSEALEKAKHLKIIAFLGTGWADEGCVDPNAANRLGIAVTNTPGANAASVAEVTLGLMLALRRQIVALNNQTKQGHGRPLKLRDMAGQRLGIVGLGAIGSRVARHARRGFEMEVVYCGPHAKPQLESELSVKRLELEELLSTSDFVTLHCPAASTRGLIGARELSLMNHNSFLINVAAPDVVDGRAIVDAIGTNRIAGAAFDGCYKEPDSLRKEFLSLPDDKLIILPRTAWLTDDSYSRMAEMALENIRALLCGQAPPNLVNPRHAVMDR